MTTLDADDVEDHDPEASPLLHGLRNGTWLEQQDFPALSWIVPGLIPEGMSLLIGGPKIGKSWLSLDIALAVAAGSRALQVVPTGQPRPVLLLALEDGDRRLQERARELLGNRPIPALLDYMTRIEPNMVVATIDAWLETLDSDDSPLVILDTLGKVMPDARPGESSYQRDYKVAGRLKRIADDRPGMALLVLHHDRKAASEDFVEGVSGTNGIAGAADTILVIARKRTETAGLFKVTGRDVVEREYAVTVEGGAWRLMGSNLDAAATEAHTLKTTTNLGDRSSEIVRHVSGQPEGVRAADVGAAMDMPDGDARRYLDRLVDAGKLRKPARGLYTPVLSVLSVLSVPTESIQQDIRDRSDNTCRECHHPLMPGSSYDVHPTCDRDAG